MEYLIFENNLLEFRNQYYKVEVAEYYEGYCRLNLINEENNIVILLGSNETTINGVLQTSAQMIIDTLSNGQS
jgi:hypothetical protein